MSTTPRTAPCEARASVRDTCTPTDAITSSTPRKMNPPATEKRMMATIGAHGTTLRHLFWDMCLAMQQQSFS